MAILSYRNDIYQLYTEMLYGVRRHQARVQEFVRGGGPKGGGQKLKAFFFVFFCFSILQGGGPAQKIAEKKIFSTKKVAKYR